MFEKKIISVGMGIQSTALYLMSSMGEIERADAAVFSDPGAEHPVTYSLIEWVLDWQQKHDGIPLFIVKKSLKDDILKGENSTGHKFATIPAFTKAKTGSAILRRQCTREYKVFPVMKKIRDIYGLKKYKRMPMTELWLGISTDEASRMKDSLFPRIVNRYPLIDKKMSRSDCLSWMQEKGFPIPVKSSCVFCPYQSDRQWKNLKENYPDSFSLAVRIDSSIRNISQKGKDEPIYLHRQLKPLDEVDFGKQQDLFDEECEGYCGL
jgi:hypothetical protein|tara:strand:- start:54 stop:848 length:795 start_codon:yes stop_codon:yes gene_type:complete